MMSWSNVFLTVLCFCVNAEKFRSDLMKIAMTTLCSKILSQDKEHFAEMAVDAVFRLKVPSLPLLNSVSNCVPSYSFYGISCVISKRGHGFVLECYMICFWHSGAVFQTGKHKLGSYSNHQKTRRFLEGFLFGWRVRNHLCHFFDTCSKFVSVCYWSLFSIHVFMVIMSCLCFFSFTELVHLNFKYSLALEWW